MKRHDYRNAREIDRGLGANLPDSNEDGGDDAGGRGLADHATKNPALRAIHATQQAPYDNRYSRQAPCGIRSPGAPAGGREGGGWAHFSRPLSSGSGSGTEAARTAEGRATASTTTDFLGQERLTGVARARPAGLKELRVKGAACGSAWTNYMESVVAVGGTYVGALRAIDLSEVPKGGDGYQGSATTKLRMVSSV